MRLTAEWISRIIVQEAQKAVTLSSDTETMKNAYTNTAFPEPRTSIIGRLVLNL